MYQLSPKAISIHALLAESDAPQPPQGESSKKFLSTLSLRRATELDTLANQTPFISIHALLAESDRRHSGNDGSPIHFYPRSPCGERLRHAVNLHPETGFLSTLSLRRATLRVTSSTRSHPNFYPRSPCGERQRRTNCFERYLQISIHALLAESDFDPPAEPFKIGEFLSTLSLRRATEEITTMNIDVTISIHALLAESDIVHALKFADLMLFLSTLSLRRATTVQIVVVIVHALFLSTLSLRRATNTQQRHLPEHPHFYPRSPCGERLNQIISTNKHFNFYPRSPCGERQNN